MVTRRSLLAAGALSVAAAGCDRGSPGSDGSLLLREVKVFDGRQVADADSVRIAGGLITEVGRGLPPAESEVIHGAGATVLPGLIDTHTHVHGRAASDAVRFGVTTMLDMHTTRPQWLAEAKQARNGTASLTADVWTAGIGVTAPGSWPDREPPGRVPTLMPGDEVKAFVAQRVAEGSDYIKVFVNDDGLSPEQVGAVVAAAHEQGLLAVAHVDSAAGTVVAVRAGVDVLAHAAVLDRFSDAQLDVVKAAGTPVVATALIRTISACRPQLSSLYQDPRVQPLLSADQRTSVMSPPATCTPQRLANVLANVKMLHEAGVAVLAGTDAPNSGVAQGVGLLAELSLLVEAGMPPQAALAAATGAAADVFKLRDRGRIAPGKRADLIMVSADPTRDIAALLDITAIWKNGHRIDRKP